MSLTITPSKNATPIAKVIGTRQIIYLLPESDNDRFNMIPETNIRSVKYKCPYCDNNQSSKSQLIYHMAHTCRGEQISDKVPVMTFDRQIIKLPANDHEIIFITGPPKCGKSYWMNQYVSAYRQIIGTKVILFTMHDHDPTLNEQNYIKVTLSDDLLNEPLELSDLTDSLVIFDDINSSKYPKVTKYLLSLMDDIACNGRHHNINMIYINQECRAGIITKKILTMFTHLVIFPSSGESYQCQRLLKEYCGMSKQRIQRIMSLPSRSILFSRAKPQYIQSDYGVYILGKEIYGDASKIPQHNIYESI